MSSVVTLAQLVRLLKQRHQCSATPAELREQLELLAEEAPSWYTHEDTPLRGMVAKMKNDPALFTRVLKALKGGVQGGHHGGGR